MHRPRNVHKWLAWVLLGLAALAHPAHAHEVAAATQAPPVPLLWKVSGPENALYLLGSFHLLRPDDYPLSADVDVAFADAEALLLELSPAELSSPALAARMGAAALRSDGSRLDDALPAATRTALRLWTETNADRLAPLGLSHQALQRFEPWFVALTVSLVQMTAMGLDPALGMDRHMAARAATAGKPAVGLESGAQQVELLAGMDQGLQLQFLQDVLAGARKGPQAIVDLHQAWRDGDTGRLWDEIGAQMQRDLPALYQRINVARNEAWLPLLVGRLETGGSDDTLVVVGALHLLGDDGLVEGLRQRGYQVQRICSACEPGPQPR